jgi:hypothetical protein
MPATLVGCFPALYAIKTRETRKNGSLENGVSDSDSPHLTTGHEPSPTPAPCDASARHCLMVKQTSLPRPVTLVTIPRLSIRLAEIASIETSQSASQTRQ